MKKPFLPIVLACLLAISFGASNGWSTWNGGVTPNATCNPETNPDCEDGGGGGSYPPCAINCNTQGSTTGTSDVCDDVHCGYDILMRRFKYAGTRITYREATGPFCTTTTLTCWDGLACGGCFP